MKRSRRRCRDDKTRGKEKRGQERRKTKREENIRGPLREEERMKRN